MIAEPGLQVRQRRLDDPERRIDVGLHRGVEILAGDVEQWISCDLLAPGVADQDVEPAQLCRPHRPPACWQKPSSRRSPGMATALRPALLDQGDDLARVALFGWGNS